LKKQLYHILISSLFYRSVRRLFYPKYVVKEIEYEEVQKYKRFFYPSLKEKEELHPHPDYYYFKACTKRNSIIGTLILYRHTIKQVYSGDAWMYRIWVHPLYRRLGIGDALNMQALNKAKCLKCRELYVSIDKENQASVSIAKKMGLQACVWESLKPEYQNYLNEKGNKEMIFRMKIQ
jgi:L-amino acid N-acyltransferase YncA